MNIFQQCLRCYRSGDSTETKKLELDEKLERALREDSVDSSVVLDELKSLNDGVLDHSNTL